MTVALIVAGSVSAYVLACSMLGKLLKQGSRTPTPKPPR